MDKKTKQNKITTTLTIPTASKDAEQQELSFIDSGMKNDTVHFGR